MHATELVEIKFETHILLANEIVVEYEAATDVRNTATNHIFQSFIFPLWLSHMLKILTKQF